jgi:hypothetical protein
MDKKKEKGKGKNKANNKELKVHTRHTHWVCFGS